MKKIDHLIWIFLAGVLAFSGLDKLLHYRGFVNAINDYRILPIPLGSAFAPLIVSAELWIAVGLCKAPWRRTAGLQASCLMLIFTIGWILNSTFGNRGICGCWFSISMASDEAHLALNLVLIILGALVWRTAPRAGDA